jgi:hypothetical protein
MRTPHSAFYRYNAETIAEANKLTAGTVSEQAHKYGMENAEPLIVIMDALHKYADAHERRYEGKLSEDYVLGPAWLKAAAAVRDLLNGAGAIANLKDISSDTKDNGCVEAMFWAAMKRAGFEEKDL